MGISLFLAASLVTHAANWQRDLTPIPPGAGWKRMMMHVHSVYSHDACDKEGIKNGRINQKCLTRFHKAVCKNHYDVVFVTEHRGHLAEMEYGDGLPLMEGDEPILEGTTRIGVRHHCADGHTVHMFLGSENQLMPVGMTRHPEPVPGMDLEQTYNSLSPAAVQKFREAGAVVGANHLEFPDKTIETLRGINPDFVEAYNLHANLLWIVKDKKVSRIWKYLTRLLSFIASPLVQPDLLFLTFFREDETTLLRWSQLAMTHRSGGVAGIDAHENFAKAPMWDGDRPDSYRRLSRWFSNWMWLPSQTPTRQEVLTALKSNQTFLAFEIFGDPSGFQFEGTTARGERIAMGAELTLAHAGGAIDFKVTPPRSVPAASRLRVLKATDKGWVEVASGDGRSELLVQNQGAGVYRAEARITPDHLRRLLPGFRKLIREYPWAMANPIFVR